MYFTCILTYMHTFSNKMTELHLVRVTKFNRLYRICNNATRDDGDRVIAVHDRKMSFSNKHP